MTGELGQLAVCFALALSLVMAASGLWGARADQAAARSIANGAAMGMMVFTVLAFGVLAYAFVVRTSPSRWCPTIPTPPSR
jgi:cytochrome c biogenesis factor